MPWPSRGSGAVMEDASRFRCYSTLSILCETISALVLQRQLCRLNWRQIYRGMKRCSSAVKLDGSALEVKDIDTCLLHIIAEPKSAGKHRTH